MHNFKILTSPTYLSTKLIMYLIWLTHLGQPKYLPTLSTYLASQSKTYLCIFLPKEVGRYVT
jgi:hypothetical protein